MGDGWPRCIMVVVSCSPFGEKRRTTTSSRLLPSSRDRRALSTYVLIICKSLVGVVGWITKDRH